MIRVFCFLFLLICVKSQLSSFVPISTSQANIVFNGVETTLNTYTSSCSSDEDTGQLLSGNLIFNIHCPAPQYHFTYTKIGNIPQDVTLHEISYCVSEDPVRFNQTSSDTPNTDNSEYIPLGRRLMSIWDVLGFDLGGGDSEIQALSVTVAQLGVAFGEYKNQSALYMATMSNWTAHIAQEFNDFSNISSIQEAQIQDNQNNIAQLYQNDANIFNFLNVTGQRTEENFAAAQQAFEGLQSELAANFQEENAFATNMGIQILQLVKDNMNYTLDEFQLNNLNIRRMVLENDNVFSLLWNLVRKTPARRGITSAFYKDLANNLGNNEIAIIQGGIPPEADPSGENQRLTINTVAVNLVATKTVESQTFAVIYNYEFNFYAGTVWALDHVRPYSSIEIIMRESEQLNCTRPFVGVDINGNPLSENPPTNPNLQCKIWIELVITSCNALSNSFDWRTSDGPNPSASSGMIKETQCVPNTLSVSNTIVFRSFIQLQQYFANTVCTQTLYNPSNPIQVVGRKNAQVRYQPQSLSTCFLSFSRQSNANPIDLFFSLIYMASLNFETFSQIIPLYEVKIYGLLPLGVKVDSTDFPYTPTTLDSDGIPISDGSQATYCAYLTWLSATLATVPVYTFEPTIPNYLTATVSVTAINNVYPGATSDYTTEVTGTSVLLDNPYPVPSGTIIIGDINDPDIIYDVPPRSVDVSTDPRVRVNTVTFFMLPPDITITPSLAVFKELEQINTITPTEASIGLASFSHRKGLAPGLNSETLYPYCVVPGGIPTNITNLDPSYYNRIAPNGDWCNVLKEYYVKEVSRGGQLGLDLSPRTWRYGPFTIAVPSGNVTTVLGSSVCPGVSTRATGPTSLLVTLSNTGNSLIQLNYQVIPVDTTRTDCQIDQDMTIDPTSEKNIAVGDCGLVSIIVSRLISVEGVEKFKQCVILNETTIANIQANFTQDIPLDYVNEIILQTDQSAVQVAEIIAASFNIIADTIANPDQSRIDIINKNINNLKNNTYVPIFFPNSTFNYIGPVIGAMESLGQAIQNVTTAYINSNAGRQVLINQYLASFTDERVQAALAAIDAERLKNITAEIEAIKTPPIFTIGGNTDSWSGLGIGGFFSGLWDGITGFFKDPLGLANLFSTIISFAIIIVFCYLVFKAIQYCSNQAKRRNRDYKRTDTEDIENARPVGVRE